VAQTFDIRFARSAGLAGLFEAPANEFRWKGAGRLSIDASGISIAVRRGLMTLFARAQSRHIATNSVIEVYREGSALRLEFSTQESPRTVLPIWARDRKTAAQIVTLLPTQRTVEVEDDAAGPVRRYRLDRRLLVVLSIVAAALGLTALILQRYSAGNNVTPPIESPVLVSLPPAKQESTTAPALAELTEVGPPTPASRTPVAQAASEYPTRLYVDPTGLPATAMNAPAEESTRALGAGSVEPAGNSYGAGIDATLPSRVDAHAIPYSEFERFRAESIALHSDYIYMRDRLTPEGLEALEARWMRVTSRIYNTPYLADMRFMPLRELELAISRSWRDYLSIHAKGLRTGDARLIGLSAVHLAFAESLEAQMRMFAP
jgi:hypothetical protein